MKVDTRKHLVAAKYDRLYDSATNRTFIRALTKSGLTARSAQVKVVERLLADGLIVRSGDGRYAITAAGSELLDGAS